MCNIYLYGAGRALAGKKDLIDWTKITGIIDSSVKSEGETYQGKPMFSPLNFNFNAEDLYIISSSKYYWEIKAQLIEIYGVDSSKVIGLLSWLEKKVTSVDFRTKIPAYDAIEDLFYCLGTLGCKSVLSYSNLFSEYGVISLTDKRLKRWYKSSEQYVDCCVTKESISNVWPYNGVGKNLYKEYHDAIVYMNMQYEFIDGKIDNYFDNNKCHYLLMIFSLSELKFLKKFSQKARQYGSVRIVGGYSLGCILILEYDYEKIDTTIYVVTHKKTRLPFLHSQEAFSIIFAGATGKNTYDYLRDDVGENISSLNPWLNECTALYWMWKHSNEKIVGLCHYRRFFLYNSAVEPNNQNVLYPLEAESYLKSYDIIVLEPCVGFSEYAVYNLLASVLQPNVLEKGLEIVRKLLKKHQPNYVDTFEMVLHGASMYPCNMFITRREILNQYCEWLFSFIINAAKEVSTLGYEGNDKRVIGFIAERMLTVWLLKQNLKIKELPMYFLLGQ